LLLQTENTQPLDESTYQRNSVTFPCNGDVCEAWLYQPKTVAADSKPPVVIMAHGMGGQKVGSLGHGRQALLQVQI
jgi:dipeptidyl aminopeptidase/acylaminoacyl peptidase